MNELKMGQWIYIEDNKPEAKGVGIGYKFDIVH